MKRGLVLISLSLILILSVAPISASLFSDFLNKITGKVSDNETNQACTESWTCADWNSCVVPSTQTRTCTDSNNCGTVTNKPEEGRPCPTPEGTCTDTDDTEPLRTFFKGTTTNGSNSYTDYCIDERYLVEYACNAATTTAGPYIYVHTFDCYGYGSGCSNGACVQTPVACTGTISTNSDAAIKGTITNASGSYTDFCSGSTVIQYVCRSGQIYIEGTNCVGPYGTGATCSNGACVPGSLPPSINSSGGGSGGGGGGGSGTTGSNTSTTTSSNTSTTSGGGAGSEIAPKTNFGVSSVTTTATGINGTATVTGQSGTSAVSSVQVSSADGKTYATKEDGSKQEIKVDPIDAINSVNESVKSGTFGEVRIIEYQNKIVYEIDVTKQVKVIALIPANMSIIAKVDVGEGNIISVKKPWWSFLAKEI